MILFPHCFPFNFADHPCSYVGKFSQHKWPHYCQYQQYQEHLHFGKIQPKITLKSFLREHLQHFFWCLWPFWMDIPKKRRRKFWLYRGVFILKFGTRNRHVKNYPSIIFKRRIVHYFAKFPQGWWIVLTNSEHIIFWKWSAKNLFKNSFSFCQKGNTVGWC